MLVDDLKFKNGLRRLSAHYIDGILLLPFSWLSSEIPISNLPYPLKIIFYIIFSMTTLIYITFCHGKFGATLGKKLLALKVLDVSEKKLSWKQAFLRESPPILFSLLSIPFVVIHFEELIHFRMLSKLAGPVALNNFPFWVKIYTVLVLIWTGLEWITMLTNSKRRAIHDFIAGSVVIRTDFFPNLKVRTLGFFLVFIGTIVFLLSFILLPQLPFFHSVWSDWPFENKWLIDNLPHFGPEFFQAIIIGIILILCNRKKETAVKDKNIIK